MEYAKLSAIELQREIDRAEYYAEDSSPQLWDALKEIDRLRTVCQEVIETINTDPDFIYENGNVQKGLIKLEDIAQRYFAA